MEHHKLISLSKLDHVIMHLLFRRCSVHIWLRQLFLRFFISTLKKPWLLPSHSSYVHQMWQTWHTI